MIICNYAKDTQGLFTRIIRKISILTIPQYINSQIINRLVKWVNEILTLHLAPFIRPAGIFIR